MPALVALLLVGPALVAELGAWHVALGSSPNGMTRALGLHLVAALLYAFVARAMLPPRDRMPGTAPLALFATIGFFIPLFGMPVVTVIALTRLLTRRHATRTAFALVPMPDYTVPRPAPGPQFRAAGLTTLLLDDKHPPALRLRSLRVMQTVSLRRSSPILNRLLEDPVEEMRMSAHALLERESRRMTDVIRVELAKLAQAATDVDRYAILRRIAEHYWELVYTGIAHGDTAGFAIDEALARLDEAARIAPRDTSLWQLRAKLLRAKGAPEVAALAYQTAVADGLAPGRAAPYIAEIAFERGDLRTVRQQMALVEEDAGPMVVPIAQFWQTRMRFGRAP